MAYHLVIVEAPSKARTIEKYLGAGYTVRASMGHLRDLPKSKLGVDIDDDFRPDYVPSREKSQLISELKKLAKGADLVYLASDPDREGEAISWHLQQLLDLPPEKTCRVTFNEITRKVVQESIRAPRAIDQALVDSQQARRVLDRLVGYQVSPVMWRKIQRGLSAGRVQSVATRMVDDREQEIAAFEQKEYWSLDALMDAEPPFTAAYYGKGEKESKQPSHDEITSVLAEVKDAPFTVKRVQQAEKRQRPRPPFTTSTLQQDASSRLNMTPRQTMAVAQQLYEGVELPGEGSVGLITYMRTDSLRISEEALTAARAVITERFGQDSHQLRRYSAKAGAQDAHEAIRPSDPRRTPESLAGKLKSEQLRLYTLIWNRFIASQMADALYDTTSVSLDAAGYTFRAAASRLRFAGYKAVYQDAKEEESRALPQLSEGQTLRPKSFEPKQHFTQPPARYTEATLIRAMEEAGIGRPSTYAPTITTILSHNYVEKEGKSLKITPLGHVVTDWMKRYFPDIEDMGFTADMETRLDEVAGSNRPWQDVIRDFYGPFTRELNTALEGERVKLPVIESQEICPECGRRLIVRTGRFGQFLGCPGFPECSFTMPLVEEMPGRCPKCSGRLLKRQGKSQAGNNYTIYVCENNVRGRENSTCDFSTFDVPVEENCPSCGQTMFKPSGRGRHKPFCINPDCPNFTPEDKRGHYKKPAAKAEDAKTKSAKSSTKSAAKSGGRSAGSAKGAKSGGKTKTASRKKAAPKKKS